MYGDLNTVACNDLPDPAIQEVWETYNCSQELLEPDCVGFPFTLNGDKCGQGSAIFHLDFCL